MKKTIILLIFLIVITTISCDNQIKTNGRVIFISVVSDYTNTEVNKLPNTPNDQAALAGQIEKLAKNNVEMYLFRVENGKTFYAANIPSVDDLFSYEIETVNTGNMTAKRIKSLFNENHEKYWSFTNVIDTIENLNAGKDDLIIFHYSGHGMEDGTLALDLKDQNKNQLGVNNLLYSLCNYNKDAIKLMLIDSCYSGNYIKPTILSSIDKIEVKDSKGYYSGSSIGESISNSLEVALGNDTYGTPRVYIMAAASKGQESFDSLNNGEKNQNLYGAFTFYLLQALGFDTANTVPTRSNKEITFYSLYSDIWKAFPSSSKKNQTPRASLSPIDIVLF